MERIPPKERFSQHQSSISTPSAAIEHAIREFGWDPFHCRIEPLSGGFMNANFLVSQGMDRKVFRVYSRDHATAVRERDLLRFLENTQILCPKTYALMESDGQSVGVIEYVDGITLEDKLLSGQTIDLVLYEEIGRQLALIHQFQFEDAGFISAQAKPGKEYEDFGLFIRQFIEKTLNWLESRPDRLDLETNRRLRNLVSAKWDVVLKCGPTRQLAHCDFNPKNILMSRTESKVAAIIDWEFCLAGNGLIDLGNFFRFFYDYSPEARAQLASGYRSIDPKLPANWEEIALLLDIGNMCSFLERKEDYQKSFRTARVVIHSTLERFGY